MILQKNKFHKAETLVHQNLYIILASLVLRHKITKLDLNPIPWLIALRLVNSMVGNIVAKFLVTNNLQTGQT